MDRLRADRPDLGALSDRELVDRAWEVLDAHFRHLFTQHIYVTFLASVPLGVVNGVAAAIGDPTASLRLLAGLGDVESAFPSMAMWDLGRRVAASAELTDCSTPASPASTAACAPSPDADAAELVTAFDEFLLRYGSRGPNEWEMRSPTWETEPDLALAAIDRMRLVDAARSPYLQNDERKAEREELAEQHRRGDRRRPRRPRTVPRRRPRRHRVRARPGAHQDELRQARPRGADVPAGVGPAHAGGRPLPADRELRAADPRGDVRGRSTDPAGWHDRLAEREQHYLQVAALQEPFVFEGTPPPIAEYPRRDAAEVVTAGGRATCCRASRAVPARPRAGPGSCSTATIRRPRARRHPRGADHRSVVDAAVRPGRGRRRRRRRAAEPRRHRQSRARHPVRRLGDRSHQVASPTAPSSRSCGDSGTVTVLEGPPG